MFDFTRINEIKNRLVENKQTLAVAESVTSGFLQAAFSSAENASLFFQGGITAYNLAQKFRHLDVEPIHAESVNCVSPKVAREMATHCTKLFHSDWGIGITGYASPMPQADNRLFALICIAHRTEVMLETEISSTEEPGPNTQLWFVGQVVERLLGVLKNEQR